MQLHVAIPVTWTIAHAQFGIGRCRELECFKVDLDIGFLISEE